MEGLGLKLLFLCPAVFFAGFVDSVAGGGGLITLPCYLFAGVPVHLAYGTNKFASMFGTAMASVEFAYKKRVRWRAALIAAAGALVGSWTGSHLALLLSERLLEVALMIVLPLAAVFFLSQRGLMERDEPVPKELSNAAFGAVSLAIGLAIGCYDGLFGPGTGTFLMLAFSAFLGMGLIESSGSAKIVNLASNLAAAVTFLGRESVLLVVAVPCAACSILGGLLGSRMAIQNGTRIIRPVIVLVMVLLAAKVIGNFIG